MARKIKVNKFLSCGCCGYGFRTWKGYVDQDQDNGYGICKECQGIIEKHNEAEWDKAIGVLRNGLNEKNREHFNGMERAMQKALVWKALDDGILRWTINGR